MRLTLLTVVFMLVAVAAARRETVDELLDKARTALKERRTDDALAFVTQAIEKDPKDARPYFFRGTLREDQQKHTDAIADFDKAIALDAKLAEAYNQRGSERFKLGQINESLADFDKYLELKPEEKPGHWKRGISLYYAGKYAEGKKQFEGYEKVDTNDVENAVWHFLCAARGDGVEKARANLLKIGKDKRVPMMEVYDLFAGKAKPADVMEAATGGQPSPELLNRQLFYAHLYLGLYAEATGEPKRALQHLTLAADKHKVNHYMWDVAKVHSEILKKQLQNPDK